MKRKKLMRKKKFSKQYISICDKYFWNFLIKKPNYYSYVTKIKNYTVQRVLLYF